MLLIGGYILSSFAVMKALKILGYDKPWLAWIPYGLYFALTEATGYATVDLNLGLSIDMNLFRFWWVLIIVTPMIPGVGMLLTTALNIIVLGWNYGVLFAALDSKDYDETKGLGYVAGFFGIVAFIKFLTAKPQED